MEYPIYSAYTIACNCSQSFTHNHPQFVLIKYISLGKLLLVEHGPVADLSLVTSFVMADYVNQLQVRPESSSIIYKPSAETDFVFVLVVNDLVVIGFLVIVFDVFVVIVLCHPCLYCRLCLRCYCLSPLRCLCLHCCCL